MASFTTSTDETIDLVKAFPDETFRKIVLQQLQNYNVDFSSNQATKAQLEKITTLYNVRNSLSQESIKSIQGIEYLTNVNNITLKNHDIEDISAILKLTSLSSIDLSGNNISKVGDISKLANLTTLSLNENLLSEDECASISSAKPVGCRLYTADQRTGGYNVIVEDTYYVTNGKTPVYAKPTGHKGELDYTFKFKIDGNECPFVKNNSYDGAYKYTASDLEAGSKHTLTVEFYDNDTLLDSKEAEFQVTSQEVYLEDGTIYTSAASDSISIQLRDSDLTRTLTSADLIGQDGKRYGYSEYVSSNITYRDSRLNTINPDGISDTDNVINSYSFSITPAFYLSAGDYNLKLYYKDDGENATDPVILEKAIYVEGADAVFIESCTAGYDYDNTGDYLYLQLKGTNIDPAKLTYTLKNDQGVSYSLNYVSHKEIYGGVVAKLKKSGAITNNTSYTLHLEASDAVIPKNNFSLYMSKNIYFAGFNNITNQLELGITRNTNVDSIKVSVTRGYNGKEVICTGEATVKDGLAYVTLYKNGEVYRINENNMYAHVTINGIDYVKYIEFGRDSSERSTDKWEAPAQVVHGETVPRAIYYYSALDYDTTKDKSNYKFTIEKDGEVERTIDSSKISTWSYESNGSKFTTICAKDVELSTLDVGSHAFKIYYKGTELSSKEFVSKEGGKFYLNFISIGNIGDLCRVYLETLNTYAVDDLTLVFRDINGEIISEAKRTDKEMFSTGGYLYYSGLSNYRKVYVTAEYKNSSANVCKYDGTEYFSDEKGELLSIYKNSMGTTSEKGRLIGVYTKDSVLPATVNIYRPYDTEQLITQITINKSDLSQYGYYYFSKDVYQKLPDPDGYYSVVMKDAYNKVSTINGVLGYVEDKEDTNWDASIDKTEISLDETATLTYTGRYKVSVESTNKDVVTVKKGTDSNTYIITPVQRGYAQIIATANGESRYFDIQVISEMEVKGIALNCNEFNLTTADDPVKFIATIIPIEAMDGSQIIEVESDHPEVATAEIAADYALGVIVTPVGAGDATITVSIPDTEYTASCEVHVVEAITSDEIEKRINEVGTLYALTNTADGKNPVLGSVALPENWSWVDESIVLTADDAAPIQYFDAYYTKAGTQSFTAGLPVAVSKVTGVVIWGPDTVLSGEEEFHYEAGLMITGYQELNQNELNGITYTWTGSKNMTVITDGTNGSKGVMVNTAKVSKTAKENLQVTVIVNTKTKVSAKYAVTLLAEPVVDNISVELAAEQPDNKIDAVLDETEEDRVILSIEASDIDTKAKIDTVWLDAKAFVGEEEDTDTVLSWKADDTAIVNVKADKTGRQVTLTAKKAGTTVLTATAKDSGAFVKEIEVEIREYAPVVEGNKFTVNQYLTDGVQIPYYIQNGNEVTGATLIQTDKKGTESAVDGIKVTYETDKGLTLEATKEYTKNTNYNNIILRLTTDKGEYDSRISVAVDTKKPAATVSQTGKANLFYTDAEAEFQIKSNYEIEKIEDVTDDGGIGMQLNSYDADAKTFVLAAKGLDSSTLKDFKSGKTKATQRNLKITFAGYKETAAQTITVKVSTTEAKPAYGLAEIKYVAGMDLTTPVIDTKSKTEVAEYDLAGCSVKVTKPSADITASLDGNRVSFVYNGSKAASYELALSNDGWTQSLTLKSKLSPVKQPELQLAAKSLVINDQTTVQKNGFVTSSASLKNNDMEIDHIEVYGKNPAAKELLNKYSLYVGFDKNTQEVEAGINKGKSVKAGSYTYVLVAYVKLGEDNWVEVKEQTLTIKVVDGKKSPAKATVSAKGSINLLDRAGTEIVYTPKFTNMSATVVGVELEGNGATCFETQVFDGLIYLRACDGAALSTKNTYKLTMKFTLDNGYEGLTAVVNVKPTIKYPKKITATMTKGTLYKASGNELKWTMTLSDDAQTEIEEIIMTEDGWRYFNFDYVDGKCILTLNEEGRKVKANKTYPVTFQVKLKNEAYNVAPKTVKMNVTIK